MVVASREFQVMVKPAGALCNMACRYCYYLEKADLYASTPAPRMSEAMLETYIAQHIAASSVPTVAFSWHGGEPTVLGLDYFRTIVTLQRKHLPKGRQVFNGVQTNGLLLDEDWCRFFADEHFGVGLSLDGPAELHDDYRVTRGEEGTARQVLRAFRLLRRHKVTCNILCVVHDRNVQHPTQVYRFLKEIGSQYVGFLPLVERTGPDGEVSPRTVPAEAYGRFLCAIFDEWVQQDVGRIMVQIFDEVSRPARGLDHSLCIFRETCGDVPVVEHNGDFYCCDHFVTPAHRLGNLAEVPLATLLESRAQRAFGEAKRDTLPGECRSCEVLAMCNGGCPKDRFRRTSSGEPGLNYLCAGFKRFFTHARRYFESRALAGSGATGAGVSAVAGADRERYPGAGRNDPCPCGSGRKYKKCCLLRK